MANAYLDRFAGSVVADMGKQPCDAACTVAITTSGYQVVDGVNLNADYMRCLVMGQSDTTQNGIYIVFDGAWTRSADFSGPNGTVNGQLITVTGGTNNTGLWQVTTPNPISIDGNTPSNITFSLFTPAGGTLPKPGSAGTILTSNGLTSEWDVLNVQAAPFGFLWPAYIYPANIPDGTQGLDLFNQFIGDMGTYPEVPVIAIMSPADDGVDSNYESMISNMIAAGALTIVYIYTEGATRDIDDVKASIDGLIEYYPQLQGFFVDEMNPDDTYISYYEEVAAYILGKNPNYYMVGNGGENLTADFFSDPVFDLYCIYENSNGGFPTVAEASNGGIGPRSKKATIVGNQTFSTAGFAIQTTSSAYVWLTDAPADAAYESLPSYMTTLFQILSGLTVAAEINGILQPVNGGLGVANPFENNILMGNGSHPINQLAPTLPGDVVQCDGVTFLSAPPIGFGNFVPCGMLIPAYDYPNPDTYFTTMLAAGASNPNVPMIFALTPAYTGGADANYTAVIALIQAAGYQVVVVVDSDDMALDLSDAQARCAILQGYYPTINGFIVVGMPNTAGAGVTYMQGLYTYIKSTLGCTLVVGDPGTTTPAAYFDSGCADIIIAAATAGSYPNAAQVSNGGFGARSQLSTIVSGATYDPVSFALAAKYCAWVYATDTDVTMGLTPTALTEMFALLDQLDEPPAFTVPAASIVCNPKSVASAAISLTGTANQIPRINPAGTGLEFTSGGMPIVEVTGTTQQMVPGVCYIANNSGLVTLTLPANFKEGDEMAVLGKGSGGWKIAQNASQEIFFAAAHTTSGTGGYMSSAAQYNNVHLKAIAANTSLTVTNVIGSPTCT